MTITKEDLEKVMNVLGISPEIIRDEHHEFILEVYAVILQDLNKLIRELENICSGLEILETEFLNKRTVTQDKYPNIYRLLSDLKDARVTFKMKRENDA